MLLGATSVSTPFDSNGILSTWPLTKSIYSDILLGETKKRFRLTSFSIQEYLQAIYRLQVKHAPVSTTKLAAHLDVAPASVTGMVRKLDRQGLVEYVPYQGVTLTPAGKQEALRLLRIHRLWELFLTKALGIPWDEVHAEAHRLEHATSDRLADRLAEFLDQPQTDPHGQRIPSRDGALPSRDTRPLSAVGVGQVVTLAEVPDGDPELLRYLGELALYPGTEFEVVAVAPFNGPLTIRLAGGEQVLGRELAEQLLVTDTKDNREEQYA
ncbi:MAG: metal-dependent transcriptional regulator [Anaerolineae bacterium]|nr:metal-dependent transcriptional regulator [Anaerolineae bacterium]